MELYPAEAPSLPPPPGLPSDLQEFPNLEFASLVKSESTGVQGRAAPLDTCCAPYKNFPAPPPTSIRPGQRFSFLSLGL